MDPALLDLPVGGRLRHWLCRALASFWADSVRKEYDLIGGSSPLNRLTKEQAESLEAHLNEHFGDPSGVDFQTYVLATNEEDTLSTYTNSSGEFTLGALAPGTYDVTFQPENENYQDSTLTDVEVTVGDVTDVGTIVLEQ
jgi:hypothetical protein